MCTRRDRLMNVNYLPHRIAYNWSLITHCLLAESQSAHGQQAVSCLLGLGSEREKETLETYLPNSEDVGTELFCRVTLAQVKLEFGDREGALKALEGAPEEVTGLTARVYLDALKAMKKKLQETGGTTIEGGQHDEDQNESVFGECVANRRSHGDSGLVGAFSPACGAVRVPRSPAPRGSDRLRELCHVPGAAGCERAAGGGSEHR